MGFINPNGSATTAWFEWGRPPVTEYYNTGRHRRWDGGCSAISSDFNLQERKTYHFRAVGKTVQERLMD